LRGFLRLEGEYNDNFFLSKTNPRSEFRETVTPGIGLRFSRGRSQADIFYAPSLVHSSVNEGEVQVFHFLDANGSLAATERLTLRAADRFLRSDVPALTDPRGTRRDRNVFTENALTSDLTYQQDTWSVTPRYFLTVNRTEAASQAGSTQSQTQGAPANEERSIVQTLGGDGSLEILERNTLSAGYDLTLADSKVANDFVGHTGRAAFSRQLNPLTTASVAGSLSRRNIPGGTDFNIYTADVGIRRDVSPLYTLEGRVGYNATDATGGGSAQGLTFLLRGVYTAKALRFVGTSNQSIQETFLEKSNVGLTETREGTLEIRYELTDRLNIMLRGRLSENTFLQSTGTTTSGQGQDRKDTLLDGGIELAYQLTRLLSLTLGYTYTSADSNLPGLSYQNNRVRLGLTATYE